MTKAELISYVAEHADITKISAEKALNSFIQTLHESLDEFEWIRVTDLGTFSIVRRKARNGVNPRTGVKIQIPASKAIRFSAAKALKDTVSRSE
jgi:DNA-binding protein HU-beta